MIRNHATKFWITLKSNQHHQLILLIIVFASLKLTLFPSINLGHADEGYYLNAAQIMRDSKDFLIPQYYWGSIRVNKPIGLYWLVLISQFLFGKTLLAARLVTLVSAIGTISLSYVLTLRLFPQTRYAIVTPFVLISFSQYNQYVHYIIPEITLVFFLTLSHFLIWEILQCHKNKSRRKKLVILFYASMGFGFMIKGPAAIILPLGTYSSFALFTYNYKILVALIRPVGPLVFALIILPWYIFLFSQNPDIFFQLYQREILDRLSDGFFNSRKLLVPIFFFPWILLFVFHRVRVSELRNQGLAIWFILCWLLFGAITILFVVQEYHPQYLLDLAVPAAIGISAIIYRTKNCSALAWVLKFLISFLVLRTLFLIAIFTILNSIIPDFEVGIVHSIILLIILVSSLAYLTRTKHENKLFYVYAIAICFVLGQFHYQHNVDRFIWKHKIGSLYETIIKHSNHNVISSEKFIYYEFTKIWSLSNKKVGGFLVQTNEDLLRSLNKHETEDIRYAIVSAQTYELLKQDLKSNWSIKQTKYYTKPDFNQIDQKTFSNESNLPKRLNFLFRFLKTRDLELLFFKYYLIEKKPYQL